MPAGWVAGAIALGAVGSVVAANTQANAAQNAANTQAGMFSEVMGNEQPFINAGKGALAPLNYALGIGPNIAGSSGSFGGLKYGQLNAPFTTDTFHGMSPAYQFTKQQGTQGVLNADTSGQGATGGAALKDLISFNSQNANLSFNNAFNQYQTQQSNIFGRLATLAGIGMQAGSGGTTGAPSFANSIGQQIANVGTAQAGGVVGATNSMTGAIPWLMAGQQTPATAGSFYPNSVNNWGDTSAFTSSGGGGAGGGAVPY